MRYVCINGHDQDVPGPRLSVGMGGSYHECAVLACHAEAEPVTETERNEIMQRIQEGGT